MVNCLHCIRPAHKFIEPVFAKTRPKRSFSMTENESFRLVFAKTGSINSSTGLKGIKYIEVGHNGLRKS
jgi:hypothetical protein